MVLKRFSLLCLIILATITASSQNFINHRGQDLFLSGINIAWISYGNDLTGFDSEEFETVCREVSEAGGNSLRWWLHVDGRSTPTYDANNDTVIGIDSTALENLALAMDIAANHGVVVSLCLWSHGMLTLSDNNDGGTTLANTRIRRNKLLLTDSVAARRYIDKALIPMVEKVKNHTAVLCWEIFNEPEGMTSLANWATTEDVEMTDIQRFVNWCAGAIHRTDPNTKVSNGNWTILSTSSFASGENYYTDSALVANGHDADGILDFYMFHYYPSERGSDYSPFYNTYEYFAKFGVDKPLIIGEFPAYGMIKKTGTTFIPRSQKDIVESMLWLYNQGYSGGWGWTYSNHDGNGGLPDMVAAFDTLKKLYPEHIIIQHDSTFNYLPKIVKRIPDTVLFKNAEKITNYANATEFFTDDANDVLTFSISSTGVVQATLSENEEISLQPLADTTGYGFVTVKATDKGGKTLSQTFFILVREEQNTSDNKLLNAFCHYSTIEDDLYPACYANDGIDSTRWSTEYEDNQFIIFDMMKEETVRRIVLKWEKAYAQAYTIETSSDNINWNNAFIVKQGQETKSNIIIDETTCRYIKINFTKRATSWGYSLYEVEAYSTTDEENNSGIKLILRNKYQSTYVDSLLTYQVLRSYFSDNNYDVLDITATNLPSWLSFEPYTFILSGTPTAQDTGSNIITITAADFFGETKSYNLEIYVWPSGQTSIQDVKSTMNIYPNPCDTDFFTISVPNIDSKALASFSNTAGSVVCVKQLLFKQGKAICSTDNLHNGIYNITIIANGKTYEQKVLIEK